MKVTKTLLTTALFAFSTAMISPVSYANDDAEAQFQQGYEAAQKGDFHTAFKLLKPLAEQGNAYVQFVLGNMYSNGIGTKQDYAQAFKWYQKAAVKGEVEAQFNLGIMYAEGQGVKQDDFQAFKWFQKAAEQEQVSSQIMLGTMYANGVGVEQDEQQAKYWANKACDNGEQLGCDMYRWLSEKELEKNQNN